ncbi:glycosyltransferase family 2 protein [Kaistella antarctica]|uniref:dTDP-Rha:alpha-D-GlcNAc-pyrophosphate polyprenol, alpha-3-L-rhamnosyltransferase n=1 Tax=Kaistella antarctica TaxID=266748 RepID=A0A448NS91_9FLAO|nr:glycosyltransferase family 2 protein [Kaistella antarctica]SEV79897.1 Glycosyltransferase, GT2 family [Kaistella antarctica]VEH99964.1 dTDP-Rha:alpha-D-GlcNAc-pyrophosphate polyprenol, alpha-3-L-rhamnosyltransferase [Kaistella antarctica]
MEAKIHFIIVTYNAMKWAERCFSSLGKSSIPVQVIVVDNSSTDGTQDYLKTQFPEVELIQSPENMGFGKANNLGIEIAYKKGADFFYLMNQDAWIYDDSVEQLLNVYNDYGQKQEIGILSPMHLDGSEKNLDLFLDKYISQNFETRMISDLYLNSVKNYYEISFINAAHWFIPRDTIEKVGGFNPYFFHYGEDNEYVNRLTFHGKKILLCPNSKAVHDGKQELGKVDYQRYQNNSLEIKILDPTYKNGLKKELQSLQLSRAKNFLKGNINLVKELTSKYKKIKSESLDLEKLKTQVSQVGSTFLNL